MKAKRALPWSPLTRLTYPRWARRFSSIFFPAAALCAGALLPLRAQVVAMQDAFAYTASNINGHAPATGSGTWSATYVGTANISTNGSAALLLTNGGTAGGGGQALANFAFTPSANTIYTVQTTWQFTGPMGSAIDCWAATGFSNSIYGGNIAANNAPWMLIRPQATAGAAAGMGGLKGTTAAGSGTVPAADYSAPITTTVTWNTATNQAQYYLNGVLQSSWTTTTTAPSGSYNAFIHSASTGNFVNCKSITLTAQRTTGMQMQDNFTYVTSNIAGHAPTTTPAGLGTWTTWPTAGAGISTDGTEALIKTNASGTAGSGGVTAGYEFLPSFGGIYTATATFDFTTTATVDCWASIGFSDASGANKSPWMLIRPQSSPTSTGGISAEVNGSGVGSGSIPASYYSGPITATVVWNTTTGLAQFYVNNLLVSATWTPASHIPTGSCYASFQGFQTGNVVNVYDVSLVGQGTTVPQVWIAPPNDVADLSSFFNTPTPNTAWPTAQTRLGVFQLNDGFFQGSNFTTNETLLGQYFTYCHSHGLKAAIGTYALSEEAGTCGVTEGYTTMTVENEDIGHIKAVGGTADIVDFDGPLTFGVYEATGGVSGGCGLSIATAAAQTASYIELWRASFPNAQFVDIESVGTTRQHPADVQTFLTDVSNDVLSDTGKPFAFSGYQIDMDWRNDPYAALSPILPTLAQDNITFGIIFNGLSEQSAPLDSTSNTANMLASEENIQEYNASGLPNPLGIIDFASWGSYDGGELPSNLLPETTFGTYTNLLDFFFTSPMAFQPPPLVMERVYNPTANVWYLSTSFTDIATKIGAGWHDQGAVGGIESTANCAPGLIPLYEYRNATTGGYAYSTTYTASLTGSYAYSGVKGYVFPDSSEGGTPLYQFYDSTHNWYFYALTSTNPGFGTFPAPTVAFYVTPRWMPAPGATFP